MLKLLWKVIVWLWNRPRPLPRLKPGELPTEAQLAAFYLSPQWTRLAWKTKKRYGWRCMKCGATWRTHKIVTDHIKSLRYHWELGLDPDNCQILCDPCNQRKGARDATDYR